MLIVPICAHSLSFRPIVLPEKIEIKLQISQKSRTHGMITCDGTNIGPIRQNEDLIIK
jgi:NAD+ kinase